MGKFTVTYEVVTPESAADGEASESGFADTGGWKYQEPASLTLKECLTIAQGGFEASQSAIGRGTWFTTVDADFDYATGAATTYSIHPPRNCTLASLRRIARVLGCAD